MYNNMTPDEAIVAACEDLVGTCIDTIEQNLEFYFERFPTEAELAKAVKYLEEVGIQPCDCCGWWHNDNEGIYGNLCWRCAEDEELDGEDE